MTSRTNCFFILKNAVLFLLNAGLKVQLGIPLFYFNVKKLFIFHYVLFKSLNSADLFLNLREKTKVGKSLYFITEYIIYKCIYVFIHIKYPDTFARLW